MSRSRQLGGSEPCFCIWCPETDPARFRKVEHVVSQAFGVFSNKTPTLKCVCDGCNEHFAKGLDLLLARGTIDGLRRLRLGRFSDQRYPNKRLQLVFEANDDVPWLGGTKATVNMQNGLLDLPCLHLIIKNHRTGRREFWIEHELASFVYDPNVHGVSEKEAGGEKIEAYIRNAPSVAEFERFETLVNGRGLPFQFGAPQRYEIKPQPLDVEIEAEIDADHIRAVGKNLVNFAAYYLSPGEVTSARWQRVRDCIRHSTNEIKWRPSRRHLGGHLDPEFQRRSIKMRIWNHKCGIVGSMQFYEGMRYDLLLVEGGSLLESEEVGYEFVAGERPYLRYPPFRDG